MKHSYRHAHWTGSSLRITDPVWLDGAFTTAMAAAVVLVLAFGLSSSVALGWLALSPLLPTETLAWIAGAMAVVAALLWVAWFALAGLAIAVWERGGPTYHFGPQRVRVGLRTVDRIERVLIRPGAGERLCLVIDGAGGAIVLVDAAPAVRGWTWVNLQWLGWEISRALEVPLVLEVDQEAELAAHHARVKHDLQQALAERRRRLPTEHTIAPREPACLTWDHHGATSPYGSFDANHLYLGAQRHPLASIEQIEAAFIDRQGERVGGLWLRTAAGWGMGPEASVRSAEDCADLHGLVQVLRDRIRNAQPPQLGSAEEVPQALLGLRQRVRCKLRT